MSSVPAVEFSPQSGISGAVWPLINEALCSVAAEMVVDPETTPYLDIANQTGRSIRIPPAERKVSLAGGLLALGVVLVPRSQELLRMRSCDSLQIQIKFILGVFVSFLYLFGT